MAILDISLHQYAASQLMMLRNIGGQPATTSYSQLHESDTAAASRGCRPQLKLRRYASLRYHVKNNIDVASSCININMAADMETASVPHDVVIAGGGVAGLATALALHRVGMRSVVLEQSPSLRRTGTAVAVWTNGWKALDALGIADGLRSRFQTLSGIELYTTDGVGLLDLTFPTGDRGVELRSVDRQELLEALVDSLPTGTVCYDSRVMNFNKSQGGYTIVQLQNGSTKHTKVLIGCDGIGSVVAKRLGLGGARYVGYTGIRGLVSFPKGHGFKNTLRQTLGCGVRMGMIPMDSKNVYWFLVFNHPPGEKVTDPQLIKEEALRYVEGWPQTIIDVVKRSPLETLSRSAISDRWIWPYGGPKLYNHGVTVAGDAMHPLTPNLAQGGCCALEDGVILGHVLSQALGKEQKHPGLSETKRIELALESYTKQRRKRMFPLSVQAYVMGVLLQGDKQPFCSLRRTLLPKLLTVDTYIWPSFFDFGHFP